MAVIGSYPRLLNFTVDDSGDLLPKLQTKWSLDLDESFITPTVNTYFALFEKTTNTKILLAFDSYTPKSNTLTLVPAAEVLPDTEYELRVASGIKDTVGRKSDQTYVFSFTTEAADLTAPVLTSPVNFTYSTISPTYTWEEVTAATGYTLQVSDVSDMSNVVITEVLATESVAPVFSYVTGTTYYWRVNADDGTNTSAWSEIYAVNYNPTITTVPDTTPVSPVSTFYLVTSSIENYSYNVDVDTASIVITFSGNVDDATLTGITIKSSIPSTYGSAQTTETFTTSVTTTALTITLDTPVIADREYIISLPATMTNTDDVALAVVEKIYFLSTLSLFYVSPEYVLETLPYLTQTEYQIAKMIFMASLEARRYWEKAYDATNVTSSTTISDILGWEAVDNIIIQRLTFAIVRCMVITNMVLNGISQVGTEVQMGQYSVKKGSSYVTDLIELQTICTLEKNKILEELGNGEGTYLFGKVDQTDIYTDYNPADLTLNTYYQIGNAERL